MEASGLSPPKSQSIPPKSSSSLPKKSFFNSLYTITKCQKKLKATPMLLIWRWICFYPARPENTEENQPITNLKPQTFANTTVTGKKVKDSSEDYFCPQIYMIQAELSNNHQTKHFSVNCSKLFANVNICRFLHAALWFNQQGCNEGKRGAITPAPNHSGGAEICGGAE